MARRASEINATADTTRYALMRGLRPELRTYVLQQNPTTMTALLETAKLRKPPYLRQGHQSIQKY